jgi:50S ribosomal protein L16 3-hydroxylase
MMLPMDSVLGELPAATFVRDYWQKRPLVVRQAVPGFAGIVERDELLTLATRGDAVSRLVIEHPRRRRARWQRHDGPFGGLGANMLPPSHWTLLVHGIESLVPGGWELLRRFSFVPAARIDDLMVSYATDGGSVGPHDDRYDVFLLQGPGRRRWQIMRGGDRSVDRTAAIRVLQRIVADEEWLLEPGDMLYLPPGIAHQGVAEGPCFTYSIGFLAPSHGELVQSFFEYLGAALGARIDPDARYKDPDLRPPREAMELGDAMVARVAAVIAGASQTHGNGMAADRATVADFLGRLLTRPRARHVFRRPARPMSEDELARGLRRRGKLALALPSRGLVRGERIFFNGEAHRLRGEMLRVFKELVKEREIALPLAATNDRAVALLHEWYVAGYLRVDGRG